MQKDDVEVKGNKFVGTLKYLDSGSPATTYGPGYFLAFKWDDVDEGADSLKLGILPSEGTGLVEAINDPDKNGYCKVTNKNTQKLVFRQEKDGKLMRKQTFDLSELVLEPAE